MTKFISIDKDTQEKKETVFTHHFNGVEFIKTKGKPNDWDKVVFLYTVFGDSYFACYIKDVGANLFKGKKGDEFN